MCRRKIVNQIELHDMNIIIITPGGYGALFEGRQNSIGDVANTPESSEICTS